MQINKQTQAVDSYTSLGELLRQKLREQELMNYIKLNSQALAIQAIKNRQFVVGSVDSFGNFSLAANPVVHLNAQSARNEADRLARITPGKAFVILNLAGAAIAPVGVQSI